MHCQGIDLSDIAILIPQDYIQLEMDWDPVSFLPSVREFLLPKNQKLGQMGATMTSLATLQSMVASRLEDPSSMFHLIHFGFNALTMGLVIAMSCLLGYSCLIIYRTKTADDTSRRVDEWLSTKQSPRAT